MKKAPLLEAATKNGWECQWRPEGSVHYRVSGTTHDGIKWQLESVGQNGYTRWATDSVRLGEEQYIVLSRRKPSNPHSLTNLIFGFFIRRKIQKAFDEVLKEGSPDDAPGLMYNLDLQSPVLKENHYNLFVSDLSERSELDERFVRRVIDDEIEQAVLNWFRGPGRSRFNEESLGSFSIGEDGVSISAQSNLVEVPALEQFIELGLILARKARRIKDS